MTTQAMCSRWLVESVERHDDGSLAHLGIAFIATDVPAVGYRTYRLVPGGPLPAESGWHAIGGHVIENDAYSVEVDPARGGAIAHIVERPSGKELLRPGGLGNELLAYGEYPNHPQFAEGPWHLTPDGTRQSAAESAADVVTEESPIGRRIRVEGRFVDCSLRQEIVLWDGIDRVEFATTLDGFSGQDTLFRVHFPAAVEGGTAIAETGNAVVGRGFRLPQRRCGRGPLHARRSFVRLVRARRHGARRAHRAGWRPDAWRTGIPRHRRGRGGRARRSRPGRCCSRAGRGPGPAGRDVHAQPSRWAPVRDTRPRFQPARRAPVRRWSPREPVRGRHPRLRVGLRGRTGADSSTPRDGRASGSPARERCPRPGCRMPTCGASGSSPR